MKYATATLLATTALCSAASAGGLELSLASRTPPATVTTSSGLGTSDARATGVFTAAEKRLQCEGYNEDAKAISACIADWDATLPKVVSASADCPAGVLFFTGGGRYEYSGEWEEKNLGQPVTKWRGPDAKIVDLGMATEGYALNQNWRTLCPGVRPARAVSSHASKPKPVHVAAASEPFVPSAEGWSHNGSGVKVDTASGTITYTFPKLAIRGVAREGTVLFRGSLRPGGPIEGTAYAFKPGCAPAPYQVRGAYSKHNGMLTLTGAGPVRRGCDVVGFSDASPHSKLAFEYVIGD